MEELQQEGWSRMFNETQRNPLACARWACGKEEEKELGEGGEGIRRCEERAKTLVGDWKLGQPEEVQAECWPYIYKRCMMRPSTL
jgi:hypothetical protein